MDESRVFIMEDIRMATSSSKPRLVSHFFHTGPALSEFNSLGSLISAATLTQNNPAGSSTGSTTTTPGSGITTSNRQLVSLPPPVACSPFNKKENANIQIAWQTMHDSYHHSISEKDPIRPPSESNDPNTDSTTDHVNFKSKGKSKLVPQTNQDHVDDQDELSSVKMATPETEGINNEEYDHEDAVLNLSMEDHPYIVPVGIDSLFTVDVRKLKLYPAFWHGPHLDVYKGQWFYPTTNKQKFYPCDPDLADALEAAYDQIKPWDLSYEDELRSALKIGTEAEDKLKVHLKEFDHDVIFDTATQGRLYSTAVSSRISKTILTNFFTSLSKKTAGYSGGTVVIRGWDQVQSWSGLEESVEHLASPLQQSPSSSSSGEDLIAKTPTGINTTADMIQEEDLENPNAQVSELVLVIHGIGQKLAQSYDSFDFVHACNQLRLECHKATTTDPKMKDFVQNKRVQFIPIRWRHSLNFEMEGFTDQLDGTVEDGQQKNRFSMKDIQIPDSIQFVREVVTGLVLDVPLYMSPKQHKLMISAVIEQANKVYQLFCRRNPYYNGRKVSILAHSLGAALTVDILSRQPSLWTMDIHPTTHLFNNAEAYLSKLDHFCFDTDKVFLVGSPVAFFFHLHRAQLIAREGLSKPSTTTNRDTPKNSIEWRKINRVTSDEVGQYGCLAAETIYSVYISTDPVAYCMNACVDCQHSKRIKPIDVQSFTKRFLETMKRRRPIIEEPTRLSRAVSISSLSSLVANSWMGGSKKREPDQLNQSNSNSQTTLNSRPSSIKPTPQLASNPAQSRPSSMVAGWTDMVRKRGRVFTASNESIRDQEPLKKSKQGENILGRKRFLALNPTGSVDFVIPSLGLNQYVDMVTAHAAYWTDNRFARLVLIGLFGENSVLEQVGDLENPEDTSILS
ncbi:hypothetical protein MJO29_002277 [Puccinia striiformis f. sp. tritici]|nr:hypothetical protein MJO29_002277 [Puccinia striiformis f. sp. tritici]